MELTPRKLKIIEAIVRDYIETAEPIGSRTISKKYELGISPATIRNEMADLEEMGYLIQPHTSAGRVPSESAYRLYVDELMAFDNIENYRAKIAEKVHKIKHEATEKNEKNDFILKEIGKAISLFTGYPTVVVAPKTLNIVLKHLELIPVDDETIVLVVVTDTNIVRSYTLNSNMEVNSESIREISKLLNAHLKGLMISDINYPLMQTLRKLMGAYKGMLEPVLELISKMIQTTDETEVFVNGTDRILELPEYKDIIKAKAMFHILEEKKMLQKLLTKNSNPGIKIIIGKENKLEKIKDCSLITANYTVGGKLIGTVGIIGPVRMDYSKIISMLTYISQNMNGVMQRLLEVKKNE